jgi:hypothetical protein
MKEMWYIYTMGYYAAIKKEQNPVVFRKIDGIGDRHVI